MSKGYDLSMKVYERGTFSDTENWYIKGKGLEPGTEPPIIKLC